MRKYKYLLVGLVLLFAVWFFFLRTARDNKLIKEGNVLVNKIEVYRKKHNKLPTSLEDINIEEQEGIDVLYYYKRDSIHYTISFGKSLGESKIYYSDTKQWEDKYREMK